MRSHRPLSSPALAPVAWRWLLAIAVVRLAVQVACAGQYGFHRDELQVWSDAQALAWGYVPYPPVTPALAHLGMWLGGDTLRGFRLPAALAQVLATLMAGLMARELGGRRGAQLLAALALACMPFSLLQGSELMYCGVELAWWAAIAWMLLKLANGGHGRWWLGIGALIGLAMMTRYTTAVWSLALVAAALATPLRRQFAGPWPWLGALLSLLLFAPNAWWQWQHDLIYLDFVQHIHARDVRIGRTDGFWLGQLVIGANPLLAPLWQAGLLWLLLARGASRWRGLAVFYLAGLALMALSQARDYYMAPGYPPLLAAGAVAWQHGLDWLRPRAAVVARTATVVLVLAALGSSAAVMLPLAPVGSPLWHAATRVHHDFPEQVGWPEVAAATARVYRALPAEERAATVIYANNYGEAGALERYGPALGLPRVLSGVNTFWYRGLGATPPLTVIVLGDDAEGMSDTPADCHIAGRIEIPHGVDNEEAGHPDIYLCRHLRFDWQANWLDSRKFG